MSLPLLEKTKEPSPYFALTRNRPAAPRLVTIDRAPSRIETPRIPQQALLPGEQYRFHFDMTKCIGCKCCVVACNEQNGNPADIHWRRVGEIEGGWYPNTQRLHLSMGCNHCLEPSCLIGCPVNAYTKNPETGVVVHSALSEKLTTAGIGPATPCLIVSCATRPEQIVHRSTLGELPSLTGLPAPALVIAGDVAHLYRGYSATDQSKTAMEPVPTVTSS